LCGAALGRASKLKMLETAPPRNCTSMLAEVEVC
jgi:hypothetical protein